MSTKILLVRHGFSQANSDHVLGGQFDTPLTEVGESQAEAMSAFVRSRYSVSAVYSSDLQRAFRTAQSIADPLGLPVISEPRMREICCGEWDGMPVERIREKYPEEYAVWQTSMGTARPPKGETAAIVQARTVAALNEIAARHPGQTVAVVTHLIALLTLRCRWEGLPIERIQECELVSNCSVSEIDVDGDRWTPVALSMDSFLGGQITEIENHA